ncbi:MAG: radical SAM protein [Armatimonadetes bacterium]|nr:radical SAM protein [Armatimonadota bacterium]
MELEPAACTCDVLLVHCESFYDIEYTFCNLGLLYIATYLREQGYAVKVLAPSDTYLFDLDDLRRIVTSFRPALAGFYTHADNLHEVGRMAGRVRSWNPSTRTVVGGPMATALGAKLLESPAYDFLISGEGEIPMARLAGVVVRGQGRLDEVPSLTYRDGDAIRTNPRAPFIEDLDELPAPDRSFVPDLLRLYMAAGRGCPYGCTFCFVSVHGGRYRSHSPGRVIAELAHNLERYGNVKAVHFIDDTFVANPKRVREICRLIREYRERTGRDFIMYCEGRVNILAKNPWLLEELKSAGLTRLQIGIESGSAEILTHYRKNIELDDLRRVVGMVRDLGGVCIFGNFIIGGPFERSETFEASLDLMRELHRDAPGVFEATSSFLAPYPGTEIHRNPEHFGLVVCDPEFLTTTAFNDAHCRTDAFSLAEVRLLKRRFDRAIVEALEANLPGVPRQTLMNHFVWAYRYNTPTQLYSRVLSQRPALRNYYLYLTSGRFAVLEDISPEQLGDMVPFRTVGPPQYDSGGSNFHLRGGVRPMAIRDPLDKQIYAFSCGKLTVEEIADRISPNGREDFVRGRMVPLYRKLARDYQIVFYR